MPVPSRRWTDMTWEEFRGADTASWIAVLPVAAVEQHGPHLPLGVDLEIMQGYLARALPLIPGHLPVSFLPVQAVGKSNEHEAYPGTLSLSAETSIRAWTELGECVHRAGVRKIVLLNSHGGNSPIIDLVARELRVRFGMLAVLASFHRFGYPDGLFSDEEKAHGIHGGAIETSLMLTFAPDLVRSSKAENFVPASVAMARDYTWLRAGSPAGFGWMSQDLHPSGASGNASEATRAKGEAVADHGARALVALLEDVHRFPVHRLSPGPIKGPSGGAS